MLAAKALKTGIKVIGVEPAIADDVAQSFRAVLQEVTDKSSQMISPERR